MKKFSLLFLSTLLFLLSACATYKSNKTPLTASTLEGINTETTNIFLIGDAGEPQHDGTAPKALQAMQKQFSQADKNDILLFLGDNIYPAGLPSENETDYQAALHSLDVQLDIAKTFPGKTIFIPGNHDWYHDIKGLKRQEDRVEAALGKNAFLPQNGCPIKKVNVNDNTVMLVVDSQWYITNWNKQPTINDDCDIKTREDFLDEFRSEIKKARGKTTLVAIHHPMYSSGPHDNRYSFKSHLSPLPVLGTLKNVIRTTSGISNADMSNRFYTELRKNIIAASQENDKVIFLSGHEHILGYFEADNLVQIISGSGSKLSPTRVRNTNDYSHSTHGYTVLNIAKNQAVNVQFFDALTNKIDFKKEIKAPKTKKTLDFSDNFPNSVTASVYTPEETQKSGFFKFLWGDRYRDYYSTPIEVPTIKLDTLFGGLTPIRKGGGTQSKSLRLENPEGVQYVMRALKKSATQYIQAAMFKDQFVGGQFNDTAAESLMLDVFTGSHPYAFLTMAPLSDAVGVYHLNPKLYYVPKQNALGQFNNEFGDALYMIEEHASEGHTQLASGNFKNDIISTKDLFIEIHSDEDVVIDQTNYIRTRLFDMLIGDWDRHQDQWRWMKFEENGKTVYKALPRDRDQAFSVMSDGAVLGSAMAIVPLSRLLRKYAPDLKDVKGFNVEPFPLDIAFSTQMTKKDWDAQVQFIRQNLTDDVINNAMSLLPKEIQDETLEHIKTTLKQRRNNLQSISDRYYKLVSKHSVVTATDKDDYILVDNLENGHVEVSAYRKKGNTVTDRFHHRIYKPKDTKEIWIYGLDDDDTFEVKGKSKNIKIRLIGGQNNDDFKVENGKNIVVYDYKTKSNNLENVKKARIKLTDDYQTNVYNYKKPKNNSNQLLPILGANPDDGFRLGFVNTYTVYGFERNPFTAQHRFSADYYFATKGYHLNYKGEFAHVIGNLNLGIDVNFNSANFSINYFGYGNETSNFDNDFGLDYNRVKTRNLSISPELIWNSQRGSKLSFGADFESVEVHKTNGRFVEEHDLLPDYLFDETYFAGVKGNFVYSNYDNAAFPTNGMLFNLKAGFKNNLEETERHFGYLTSQLQLARKLIPSGRLVLATNLNGHFNFGNGFEFYQAAAIGGKNGLRGFRNERFTGKNSFYQNTDLRYSFSRLKTNLIPLKLGIYGGFDYGRVWTENDASKKWHNSYGGGLFVNAADLLSANLGVFNSVDGVRVAFGLGFGF